MDRKLKVRGSCGEGQHGWSRAADLGSCILHPGDLMKAFIVRPFGTKKEIDFDRVEKELIAPALDQVGITGRTTGEIVRQGNIRSDMFTKLLAADLIIADVSIHNANVFYELGVRHALRDRATFLIKSRGDDVPFDLQTDRYFYYEAADPGKRLEDLIEALKATIDSLERDSPVFHLLPQLRPADPSQLNLLPFDFREEVEQAAKRGARGVLRLLADEARDFDWAAEGMRIVGKSQFDLGDNLGAKTTWEAVQTQSPLDVEANEYLATVYDRLGNLDRSDQVLRRVIKSGTLSPTQLARCRALLGRNAKTRWRRDWQNSEGLETRREKAVRSPHLESSVDGYARGFREDRNNYYAGLNALDQVVILTELARDLPEIWRERFESEEESNVYLAAQQKLRRDLESGVQLAIDTASVEAARSDDQDGWAQIGQARLTHLLSTNPKRVAHVFTKALAGGSGYALDSCRANLELFAQLGIFKEKSDAALQALRNLELAGSRDDRLARVILFAGHRVDAPGRAVKRFPPEAEPQARKMIYDAVREEVMAAGGNLLGISAAGSGADILFQEVCAELGVRTELFLAYPEQDFCRECVQDAGPVWVERFNRLCAVLKPQILSETSGLPRWLRARQKYNVALRSTHWMIHNALSLSRSCTLIALWDGAVPDGPGGTHDIIQETRKFGVKFVHLDAKQLVPAASPGNSPNAAAAS